MSEFKKIDVHKDMHMFDLACNVTTALHMLVSYMQNSTPYGDEYKKAYELYEEVFSLLQQLKSACADCVEIAYVTLHGKDNQSEH